MHVALDTAVDPLTLHQTEEPWIDVTVPIEDGMVRWPGHPEIGVTPTEHLERGNEATVSCVSLGVHAGTHLDAPAHVIVSGAGVDAIRLDCSIGLARVLPLRLEGLDGAPARALLRRSHLDDESRRGERRRT